MIAVDTSSWIAYFSGQKGSDVEAVELALAHKQAVLPPVVLAELLSDSKLSKEIVSLFKSIPLLELHDDYWIRVGTLRAQLMGKGLKARLADTLVAQSCLDHKVLLITRDGDFRHFQKCVGLQLL